MRNKNAEKREERSSNIKKSVVLSGLVGTGGLFVAKLLGLFYSIPLSSILGSDAYMAYYGNAYRIYNYILNICTAGFPMAVATVVARYKVKEDYKSLLVIRKLALAILAMLGLFGMGMLMIMAGVMDDSDTEYLDMGVFRHVRNRLPWLLFMTVTLMITGFILTKFELVLSQVIVLVSYLPLLMGTGGNVGTQAASLVIRGMSIGEIDMKDVLRVLWKEFRISIVLGVILSLFNFAKILIIDGESILIALTVAISMITIVTFGKLLGSMLPMGAKKIGIDPALMATPMIQSISDMVSSTLYMLIAAVVLGITL